jgi:hypothetical protein
MPTSFFERGFSRLSNLNALTTLEGRFETHLRSITDESALVLTSHLHIERLVHEIHGRYFGQVSTDRLLVRMGFSRTLQLLRSTNIVKSALAEALGYLNEIRNGFAHEVTTLSAQIALLDKGRSFRNSCSSMSVARINTSSDRDLFIRWSAKLYIELTKSKFIASEMYSAMMTTDFIDLFNNVDVSQALSEPANQF